MPVEKDIEAIESRQNELKGQVEGYFNEYAKVKDSDPQRAEEIRSLYSRARQGVIEADKLLGQKREEYTQVLLDEQNRIFSDLSTPEGAGFDRSTRRQYMTTMGQGPQSYTKEEWGRGEKTDSTVKSMLSKGLKIDESKVNMGKNLKGDTMTALRSLPTPEERVEWLRSVPDIEDADLINVGGEENYLIKDAAGSYYLGFKPGGDKGRKFAAGAAVETPRIASALLMATAGGRGGLGLKSETAQKAASMTGASLRGSLGYELVEAGQKIPMRAIGGIEQSPGKDLLGSVKDAGLNLLIDTATFGLARPLSKRVGKPIIHEAQKGVQGAKENIKKQTGVDLDSSPYVSGGPGIQARFGNLRRFKNSAIAREFDRMEDSLVKIQKGLMGEGSTPVERAAMIDAMQREYDEVAKKITKVKGRGDKYAQASLKRALNKRKQELVRGRSPRRSELGETLIADLQAAQETGRQMRDEAFSGFFQQADQAGLTMNKAQVADELDAILKKPGNKWAKGTRAHEIVDQLREEAADAPLMGMEEYRGMVREISDSTGVKAVGAKTPQQIAQAVDTRSRELMREQIAGTPLADAWEQAVKTYDEAVLSFNRSSPARILAEKMGDTRISKEGAVNALLQNSKNLDDYMSAMYATGDGMKAEATRRQLQAVFLENADSAAALAKKKPIIESLWARRPDGTVDTAKADRVFDTLIGIDAIKKKAKADFAEITVQQIDEISDYIGSDQRTKLLGLLDERITQEAADKKLLNNAIISKAKQGQWDKSHSDELANALMSARPSDVRQVMGTMAKNPAAKQAIKEDMRNAFFKEFGSPAQRHGDNLIDGEKLLRKANNWDGNRKGPIPDLVARMDEMGDKETTDLIFSLARVRQEILPAVTSDGGAIRTKVLADQRGQFRLWAVTDGVADWALAHAYGKPGFKPMLRYLLKDIGSEASEERINQTIQAAIVSRLGIQAAARRGAQDPHFAADFQDMLAEIAREEAEK
jgi:hypothetical protein